MLKPLNDNVILEIIEAEKTTASGIILSGEAAKPKHSEGVVVAVGSGKLSQKGEIVPLTTKEGQHVIYNSYSGTQVTHQGKELVVISEEDILAIVE